MPPSGHMDKHVQNHTHENRFPDYLSRAWYYYYYYYYCHVYDYGYYDCYYYYCYDYYDYYY